MDTPVWFTLLVLLGLRSLAHAQACDPVTSDVGACPPNPGLSTSNYHVDFTQQQSLPAEWILANYETVTYGTHGAEFTFNKRYDAPNIWTDFHIFFGHVDVVMQAAPGQGIVSSSVLISDDFDEVDWEFSGNNFGDASSSGQVQTNFYGKGETGYYDRSTDADVNQPQSSFHTYSVDWTQERLIWSIDGSTIRTLLASQCDNTTHQYPQTPMKLQLGLWDGGDPDGNPGTVNWAGGYTNLSQAPFTMYVESVSITNYNPGYGYNYTDQSGSWESIQILNSPLSSTSSQLPSTVHTSTSSTPAAELSSSSVISSLSTPSASTSIGQSSSSSGDVASILPSSSTYSYGASSSGPSSDSDDCDCEDETSTVYLTTQVTSQVLQATTPNVGTSQSSGAGVSAEAVSSQSSDHTVGSLPSTLISPIAPILPQSSPSAPVPSSYVATGSIGAAQLTFPPSGSSAPSSFGSSGAAIQTQPSSGAPTITPYGPSGEVPPNGSPSDTEITIYPTVVVSRFTTVCPSATQLTVNNKTFTISSSTTLTLITYKLVSNLANFECKDYAKDYGYASKAFITELTLVAVPVPFFDST
ncbi:MAG: hypothetical protein M1822_006642 [Bathelium mastoideum]|nr:MAG: hypothetical protein M1822_006642 [Bathelium mastoideum]